MQKAFGFFAGKHNFSFLGGQHMDIKQRGLALSSQLFLKRKTTRLLQKQIYLIVLLLAIRRDMDIAVLRYNLGVLGVSVENILCLVFLGQNALRWYFSTLATLTYVDSKSQNSPANSQFWVLEVHILMSPRLRNRALGVLFYGSLCQYRLGTNPTKN